MTSNQHRAATLVRSLRAGIDRDRQTLQELLTDDVRAWSPALATASLDELIDELDRRDEAFSDVELSVVPLDVGGDYACVEWTVEMTHSGTIVLANGIRTSRHPASGSRCTVSRSPSSSTTGSAHCASTGTSTRCSNNSASSHATHNSARLMVC